MKTDTVSAKVLSEIIDNIGSNILINSVAFDSQLGLFNSGIDSLREQRTLSGVETPTYPLFIYNRSPLRKSDKLNRRGFNNVLIKDISEPSAPVASELISIYGAFDLKFLYACNGFDEIENFESYYHSESLLKDVVVDCGDTIGDITYQIYWRDIDNLVTSKDQNMQHYLEGSALIEGLFITELESSKKLIATIDDTISLY